MAYSSESAKTLTVQIEKFATLNGHQLAGHVANLDFWIAEVRHCLDVIDGYHRRFEQMKTAQTKHISVRPIADGPPSSPASGPESPSQ